MLLYFPNKPLKSDSYDNKRHIFLRAPNINSNYKLSPSHAMKMNDPANEWDGIWQRATTLCAEWCKRVRNSLRVVVLSEALSSSSSSSSSQKTGYM